PTIRASGHDVEFELMLVIALVVMVIFLFLRTFAATIIPSVAVPLSLVGTFGAMYLLGYSLNNLTLMALTISTGFVVDDAIVMIENIARFIEQGASPLDAALRGSEQIGFTIISLTVSLIAVLIPLLFMGDIVGRLLRELAGTLMLTFVLFMLVPKGFFPIQDTGVIQGVSVASQTASFPAMVDLQRQAVEVILTDPAVESLSSFVGIDQSNTTLNNGRVLVNLKSRNDRDATATDIIRRLQPKLAAISGLSMYMQPVQDITVDNPLSRTQFQYTLEDPNLD